MSLAPEKGEGTYGEIGDQFMFLPKWLTPVSIYLDPH